VGGLVPNTGLDGSAARQWTQYSAGSGREHQNRAVYSRAWDGRGADGELDGHNTLRSELHGRARRPELHGNPVHLPVELPDSPSGTGMQILGSSGVLRRPESVPILRGPT
jgi:hypothetical protein